MRVMGVDVGERRIGLATGDTETGVAVPAGVVDAKGGEMDWRRIDEEAAQRGAELIVVGMPYSLDGSEGPQARAVGGFVEGLRGICGATVVTWDERLSTVEAERLLRERATSGRRKAKSGAVARVDASAAAVMLQSYLDAQPRTPAAREG